MIVEFANLALLVFLIGYLLIRDRRIEKNCNDIRWIIKWIDKHNNKEIEGRKESNL